MLNWIATQDLNILNAYTLNFIHSLARKSLASFVTVDESNQEYGVNI